MSLYILFTGVRESLLFQMDATLLKIQTTLAVRCSAAIPHHLSHAVTHWVTAPAMVRISADLTTRIGPKRTVPNIAHIAEEVSLTWFCESKSFDQILTDGLHAPMIKKKKIACLFYKMTSYAYDLWVKFSIYLFNCNYVFQWTCLHMNPHSGIEQIFYVTVIFFSFLTLIYFSKCICMIVIVLGNYIEKYCMLYL